MSTLYPNPKPRTLALLDALNRLYSGRGKRQPGYTEFSCCAIGSPGVPARLFYESLLPAGYVVIPREWTIPSRNGGDVNTQNERATMLCFAAAISETEE
jgi:hypothetical protein